MASIPLRRKLHVDGFHIDESDHVNYKTYPLLLQPFQDEYMEQVVGIDFQGIQESYGLLSVVRKISVSYSGELCNGDVADVTTRISGVESSSFTFSQDISKEGFLVTNLEIVVVMLDEATKEKRRIPDSLRLLLSKKP